MNKLLVHKISPDAVLPSSAFPKDSGMDLRSAENYLLEPFARCLVRTGLEIALPAGSEGQIRGRSGLALESGITVLNSPGTIDEGYRGEIAVVVANLSKEPFRIHVGMRIAQLVVCPVIRPQIEEVDHLPAGDRGTSGFGSSGT